jgi:hypothetical protein
MVVEAIAAVLVGLAGLLLVLQPLLRRTRLPSLPPEPIDTEETPRGVALAALKEIDFDRETGKLSDSDYQFLKAKYTAIALEALRAEQQGAGPELLESVAAGAPVPECRTCGPRPERDAIFCSTCGVRLATLPQTDQPASSGSKVPAPATTSRRIRPAHG